MVWKGLGAEPPLLFSIGHQRGLTSIPHRIQTLSPGCRALGAASAVSPLRECASSPLANVLFVVESLRRPACIAVPDILAAIVMRLALRTVPVSARSACL